MKISKKTKLITTIGPSSNSQEIIEKFLLAGMTTVRLNFSHGDYRQHDLAIYNTRKIIEKFNSPISLMMDTKGPEIRIGRFLNQKQQVNVNDEIIIYTDLDSYKTKICERNEFTVSYDMSKDLKIGDLILADDGKLKIKVIEVNPNTKIVKGISKNSHLLYENKRINLPGLKLSLEFLSKKDKEDITYACQNKFDYIAASFVNCKEDVAQIKKILKENNSEHIQIISKIESQYGIENFDEILDVSDGIMVARGDLGLEIPYYEVPVVQKKIIRMCRDAGKPVIIATQMLDSMEKIPHPTRAEVTDVYIAVELGSDSIMLSGESAAGLYPVEAVKVMATISARAEKEFYKKLYYQSHLENVKNLVKCQRSKIALELAEKSKTGDYKFAIVLSRSGGLLKTISKFRPNTNVIGCSLDPKLFNYFGIHSSIFMYHDQNIFHEIEKDMTKVKEILKFYDAEPNDKYLIIRNTNIVDGVY